jgi:hypothetical protein
MEWDGAQSYVRLIKEQSELNRRRLAADLSKSITKLMETTNSWADGDDHVRKSRPRSSDNENDRSRLNGSKADKIAAMIAARGGKVMATKRPMTPIRLIRLQRIYNF